MKVFITGVAGFMGSHLADRLIKNGDYVVGVDNLVGGDIANVNPKVEFYNEDCDNLEKMVEYMKGCDVVFHAACTAHDGFSLFSPYYITKNTFQITISVLSFGLYNNPNLKLVRRDKISGAFEAMNSQAKDIVSEEYLLDIWRPDYIRSHNPVGSYIELLTKCKEKNIPHLYDQMDYWDGFPVQPWGECTEDAYIDLAVSNMTISNWLVEKNSLKTLRPFVMVPNAIKENFAEELSIPYSEVTQRNLMKRKTVVYSGAIWPEWFDWDIMSYLIEMRPQYDFLMIGAYNPSSDEDDGRNVKEIVTKLKSFDNVSFLGQISHMELIPHLKGSNVSIIPFVVNDVTEACSPLKCFEYLGASLPVVTTALPEIKDYPMVFTAHSKEEFLELIDSLLEYGVTEEQYMEMKFFIDNNTWKARSNTLEYVALDMLSQGE